ncbi:MAG: hypothetical protein GX100_03070 [candidate division WS1 bacterium]|nr:hypothetical protein [candidate division WS1 bacterium]
MANDDTALAGDGIKISWSYAAGHKPPEGYRLAGFRVLVGEAKDELGAVDVVEGTAPRDLEVGNLVVGRNYWAQVEALYLPSEVVMTYDRQDPNQVTTPGLKVAAAEIVGPAQTVGRWYDPALTNVLVGVLLFSIITLVVLYVARRREMYIRPIAGLQAVDDAIGRATEMGRPILYISGLGGTGDVSTIAAMLVLGHLAHKTAPYGNRLVVPAIDSMVMATEREILSQAYLHAGHPEAYNAEDVFYVTDSQFGYATAVAGIMMRERPAVNFFMGYFAAESLVLAETGNMIDSLQIAGTDTDTQIPFFITACDYTLMGEELYAASAYLSRDPILLAQLKAQDIGKVLVGAVLIGGILATLVTTYLWQDGSSLVEQMLGWLKP